METPYAGERAAMSLLRTFTTTDAVEGAVEVRLELSEMLQDYRTRVRVLLLTIILGVVLSILVSSGQVGYFLDYVGQMFEGEADVDLPMLGLGLAYAFIFVLVLAMGLSDVIFAWQVRRYFALLRARYGTLEAAGMGTPPRPVPVPAGAKDDPEAQAMRDPARTLLGMAREAESEVPQVDTLLKYCIAFTFMIAVLMLGSGVMTAFGITHVEDDHQLWTSALHFASTGVLALSMGLLIEAQRFVSAFVFRVRALEAFEDQGPVPVPPGETALERLTYCLTAREPSEAEGGGPQRLKGSSGEEHEFDLVLGDARDRVMVRVFDRVPRIEDIRELRTATEDVARRDRALPVRVIALIGVEIDDLDVDDIVYDYLMDHPILDDRGERARSLQIVGEVEGFYSVLPFTAPS